MKRFTNIHLLCSIVVSFSLMLFLSCGTITYTKTFPHGESVRITSIGFTSLNPTHPSDSENKAVEIFTNALADKDFQTTSLHLKEKDKIHDTAIGNTVTEYFTKLNTVNFSDPKLATTIGKHFKLDALLIVTVNFWDYTVRDGDNMAEVGFSTQLIRLDTGQTLWEGVHRKSEDYWRFKPDLYKLGQSVARTMIDYMPH